MISIEKTHTHKKHTEAVNAYLIKNSKGWGGGGSGGGGGGGGAGGSLTNSRKDWAFYGCIK